MASIIEESLELRGIQPSNTVGQIVANARARSPLDSAQAMTLALEETRRFRKGD
ncbi:MAG: hypothetical protein OXH68_09335 [Gammaproteobacteria bacterium]|nr:hypothetical protein [Gammaproteobacteria bacterium]